MKCVFLPLSFEVMLDLLSTLAAVYSAQLANVDLS